MDVLTKEQRRLLAEATITGMEAPVEHWARKVLVESAVLSLALKGLIRLGWQDGGIFTVIENNDEQST
jgi:hypothetical protein